MPMNTGGGKKKKKGKAKKSQSGSFHGVPQRFVSLPGGGQEGHPLYGKGKTVKKGRSTNAKTKKTSKRKYNRKSI